MRSNHQTEQSNRHKTLCSLFILCFMTTGSALADAQPDSDRIRAELNAEQQIEYQRQLNQASGEQERAEVRARQREKIKAQSASGKKQGIDCGSLSGGGSLGGPCRDGKSVADRPGDGSGVSAGSKNKPKRPGKPRNGG